MPSFVSFLRRPAPDIQVDEVQRAQAIRVARLVDQRVDAAEALWSAGHGVEGLRLAAAALETAHEQLRALSDPPAEVLAKLGLDAEEVHAFLRAREAARVLPAGELALGPAHAELYATLAKLTKRVSASLRRV